ncbi:ftsH [Symbiodinium natans]|uniref:FtsH protein n=1 Tax=Symbiodinium natans TaxID=878477 RepID=A0A812N7H4_9DINO|nr:ftsH [Symbiodinium natans]
MLARQHVTSHERHQIVAGQGLENHSFSGAELANVVNEAIFLALRDKRSQPSAKDFSNALDRRKAARKFVGSSNGAANGDLSGLGFRMPRAWPKAAVA